RAQAKISGEEAVKEELRKLQGTWIGVGGAFRGKESSEEESKLAGHRLVISKDKFYWYTALQKEPISQGSFKIDPTKLPKIMDLSWDGDEKRPIGKCIYELNDDVMKLCLGEPNRPTEFKTAPGSDDKLYYWKREARDRSDDAAKNIPPL